MTRYLFYRLFGDYLGWADVEFLGSYMTELEAQTAMDLYMKETKSEISGNSGGEWYELRIESIDLNKNES